MSEVTTKNITLKLNDIAHLFVAPEFDPFSDQEADLLGQPALVLVLRQLGPRTVNDGQPLCLTLQLPPDKVTPDLKARAEQALRRYCAARIARAMCGTRRRACRPSPSASPARSAGNDGAACQPHHLPMDWRRPVRRAPLSSAYRPSLRGRGRVRPPSRRPAWRPCRKISRIRPDG